MSFITSSSVEVRLPSEDANYGTDCKLHYSCEEASGTLFDQINEADMTFDLTSTSGLTYQRTELNNNNIKSGGGTSYARETSAQTSWVALSDGDFTVEFLWRCDGTAWPNAFDFGLAGDGDAGVPFSFAPGAGNSFIPYFHRKNDWSILSLCLITGHDGGSVGWTTASYTTDADIRNRNYHIGITWDLSTGFCDFYVDNSFIGRIDHSAQAGSPLLDFSHLSVLNHATTNTETLRGIDIDEFAVWDTIIVDFGVAAGGIQPYTMHHLNHNCNKYSDILHEPTDREVITINSRRYDNAL